MTKLFLKKIKEQLEEKKSALEKELQKFSEKDKKIKGDWDTKFPNFNGDSVSQLEQSSDEVEEYVSLLPIEHSLEIRLRDINLTLEKIKKGKYGICEKCGKKILKERLMVCPEARTCNKCRG